MNTLFFPFLFLLLSILLLWIIIGCKGQWSAKIWLINITVFFTAILWSGVSSYVGWPTDSPMPKQGRLVQIISNEPESLYVLLEQHDEKNLYYEDWHDFIYYKPKDVARLFKLPYDKETHEQLESAMELVKKGKYVVLSRESIKNMEEESMGGSSKDSHGGMTRNGEFKLYILPPSKFVQKPTN